MDKEEDHDLHVVMLPWLAFGHMIPFLHLSIALAKSGIRISFVSTPNNILRLPKPTPNLAAPINFIEFQLPVVPELLPSGAEATVDIAMEDTPYLKIAYDLLQQQFKQLVADDKPDWIVQDFIPHWTAEISREFDVPLITFSVFSASLLAFFGPIDYLKDNSQTKYWTSPEVMKSTPEWIPFPSSAAFPSYDANNIYAGFFRTNASGVRDAERVALTIQACEAVAVRSCNEHEGDFLELLMSKIYKKPVIPVGVLPPAQAERREEREGAWSDIFRWLDGQKPNSVVFVGFGSESKLSREQEYEIAHGLELSQLPFLWALRKPTWAVDDCDALPPDFRSRTVGRGVVCMGWIPQVELLAHPSVGGCLFHSGWGSIIEALQFGHALVVLPLVVDQGLNARMLVHKGLAVEVERGSDDGSFDRTRINRALRKAMVDDEEEGQRVRSRARDMKVIFGDHSLHQSYVDGFIQYLKKRKFT